jgi:hypothetical protein
MKPANKYTFCVFILILGLLYLQVKPLSSEQTPVTDSHISAINDLFKQNGIANGYAAFDRYGRIELKGEYYDEKEVDRAFSLAQTVVGIRWVSPVTPENIKVKEWEKRLGKIFERAKIFDLPERADEPPGPIKTRYALIIGIGKFRYGIQPLQYAVRDATSFYQFLTDPKRGGFPKENITVLTDQNATRESITRALDRIRGMAEVDDLVTIYISSHGTPPDKFGGVHIVTYDTEVKPREKVWHTALTESMLRDFVENLGAKRLVMILDTCYSNGAYRGVPGFLPPGGKSLGADDEEGYGISKEYGKRLLGAKDIILEEEPPSPKMSKQDGWGRVLFSASDAGEKAWESDTLKSSFFTYYFLEGLKKYSDTKQAFEYAKPKVTDGVRKEKEAEQHPQVIADRREWNIIVGK